MLATRLYTRVIGALRCLPDLGCAPPLRKNELANLRSPCRDDGVSYMHVSSVMCSCVMCMCMCRRLCGSALPPLALFASLAGGVCIVENNARQ